jgi:hypothetical protein
LVLRWRPCRIIHPFIESALCGQPTFCDASGRWRTGKTKSKVKISQNFVQNIFFADFCPEMFRPLWKFERSSQLVWSHLDAKNSWAVLHCGLLAKQSQPELCSTHPHRIEEEKGDNDDDDEAQIERDNDDYGLLFAPCHLPKTDC